MTKRSWTYVAAVSMIGAFAAACSETSGPAGVTSFGGDVLQQAAASETIDFEDVLAGALDPVVMGDGGTGPITTSGESQDCEDLATIYDTSAAGGADPDLEMQPQQGNVLIVEEDLGDTAGDGVPDDCGGGGASLTLDFTGVDAAGVEIVSALILDIEDDDAGNKIELFGPAPGNALLFSVQIPVTGDGGITPPLDLGPTSGVARMVVSFQTSGAVDNIVFTPPMGGTEGCTPGKWKNWTGLKRQADIWPPTGYSQNQDVDTVFTGFLPAIGDLTLLEALGGGGGPDLLGKQRILVRAAVAALLNGAHPNVDYPLTDAQVIAQVNAALASGVAAIEDLADELDTLNNDLPCPDGDLSD